MRNKINEEKRIAAERAVGFVGDGMILGLGTGSTVEFALKKLSERIEDENLEIIGIPTSNATERRAGELGISLSTLDEHPEIDLDIDGADEVDKKFNLIKGGGGAHTREKVIAEASKEFIVIVDSGKVVERIGKFPVAVEVIPFSMGFVKKKLKELGGAPRLRGDFVTDNDNLILDTKFDYIRDPELMEKTLNNIAGVLENGIFAHRKPDKVIVGYAEGKKTKILIP